MIKLRGNTTHTIINTETSLPVNRLVDDVLLFSVPRLVYTNILFFYVVFI